MPLTAQPPRTRPRVNFNWTPQSSAVIVNIAGNTYPYTTQADAVSRPNDTRYQAFTTPTGQAITFTADVTPFNGASIIEYLWDFGNGVNGYGASTTYTFNAPNPSQQVSLLVRDSNGLVASAVKTLNLVLAYPTVVKQAIRV